MNEKEQSMQNIWGKHIPNSGNSKYNRLEVSKFTLSKQENVAELQ